jgi:hypothetical protein
MSFSPNIFMANMKSKGGPAKPNRFELILPIPPYIARFIENSLLSRIANFPTTGPILISEAISQVLSGDPIDSTNLNGIEISRFLALQCESTELPGKTLQTADVKIYGPTFKVPYQTAYQEITFNFICTNEFFERKLFDRWLEAIMPTDTNNLRYPSFGNTYSGEGDTRYMTTPKIIQYNELVKQIYAIELINAFPISIASQPLSWSDDGLHRLSVQFTFQKYRTIYDGNVNVESVLSALFGTYAARLQDQAGRSVSDALSRIF